MTQRQNIPRNLILTGFMGTGKSTIGRLSAKSLGFEFADTDDLIVAAAGKTIPEIFEEDGEESFRDLETEVLAGLGCSGGHVIATGGGIVIREENRRLLKATGFVIWLKASPESIHDRVMRNRNRPLLQTEDPLQTITELLEAREEYYREAADFEVNTSELTVDEIVHGITESARIAFAGTPAG